MRILVTGGGTGGHVAPAIAVIQALRQRVPYIELLYVGSDAGIEAKLAAEAQVPFVGVATGKLRRSSKGVLGMLTAANLRDAFQVPKGILQAFRIVREFKPDAVLATGGYVSVPPVIAAGLRRIPVLTHEQTVTVGLANRIAGRFATRIALTFEGALADLPPALRPRAFVTGNPVREAIFTGERERGARRFGFAPRDDALPCVYVTGGAQGSQMINRAVVDALPGLTARARVLHQCGARDADLLAAQRANLPIEQQARWIPLAFIESEAIGDAWALCDLLLSRSGAGTVTEACALGKAAVFVPLVPTGGDEQTRNAQRSVDAGAAVILPQSACDAAHLEEVLLPLIDDPQRRAAMGAAARTLARPDAAGALADALLALPALAWPRRS